MAATPIDILLVEDNPGDKFLIDHMLDHCFLQYTLHWVENGSAAIEFLRKRHTYQAAPSPHLILLDLNLPILKGTEVLANIKADPNLQQIPVVVMSTSNAPEDIEESYRLNADYYVTKPSGLTELNEKAKDIKNFWRNWLEKT
ncbi:response regulator [Acaryochloris sp. IP29b_bin.137]|uniref:response regulator n=1 Tax=Acaryochloris sp. IP29b_bin.137 TaxID=2969217 RepID=UPI0026233F79|nr:response regulator [Acaryochloris sp. IP29b_bin.137]